MSNEINPKLLRTFDAVARARSFTRAAIALGRTQPTVSNQVSDLEHQLDALLVKRTSRRLELTEAGETLAAALEKAFGLIEAGLAGVRDIGEGRGTRVLIACVPSLSGALLPSILAGFRARDVVTTTRIDVAELTSSEIVAAIAEGTIDFGIGPCVEPPPPDIAFTAAVDEALYMLLDRSDAAELGDTIPFATLASLPLITLSGSVLLQRQLEAAASSRGIRLNSQTEVQHVQTAIAMARAGVGAAVVPRFALPRQLGPGIVALPISEPALMRKIGIIARHGTPLRPSAGKLARYVRAMLMKAGMAK